MLKFLAVKVSELSIARHPGGLHCFSSAINQKYVPFWRNRFSEARKSIRGTSTVSQLGIEDQTDIVWTELCHTNRLPVIDVQNCREIIKFLLSFRYHTNHIVRKLSENTVLLKFPVSRWKETVSGLQSYGFQSPHFLLVLAGCHTLLHGTEWNNLQEVLMLLHSLNIPDGKRQQVIARNPTVLLLDDTKPLMQSYSNLLKVFTKNEARTLITKCPKLLTDTVTETNEKINYVCTEMAIGSQEMTRSRVFEHSLAHIITRHKFAERAGVYKMPDRHEIAAKEMNLQTVTMSGNPSLSDLVDTSNTAFAHSFCSMTVAEYKAFVDMMLEELHEKTEDDADSDLSDSDSEYSE